MKAKGFPVYVAAPYPRAALARELNAELRKVGCVPTGHWATLAKGPDKLTDPGEVACALEMNRIGVECSSLVVAMLFDGEGGEMFVEAGHALWEGIPVLWCGSRLILSCHHPLSRLLPGSFALEEGQDRPSPGNILWQKLVWLCAKFAHANAFKAMSADQVLEGIDAFEAPSLLRTGIGSPGSANAEAFR